MKKILGLIVILILFFFAYLTYYKFFNYDKTTKNDENIIELGDLYKQEYNINYIEKYEKNIIKDNCREVEYEIISESSASYGRVYIAESGKLVIKDETINKSLILSDKVFTTIYKVVNQYSKHLYLLALTDDGDVYELKMNETNIDLAKLKKVNLNVKVSNFTNLNFISYNGYFSNSGIVLGNDNKMYDVSTGFLFNEKIVNVFDKYIVYEDATLSDINGKMLIDRNGEKYKVKSIILPSSKLELYGNPNIFIVTTNNKIIYLIEENMVYEYKKEIKRISVLSDNITIFIEFMDSTIFKFEGVFDYNSFPI